MSAPVSQFPNVQPDEITIGSHTVRLNHVTRVSGTAEWSALVVIVPAVDAEPDLVLGLGSNSYAAIADAFALARKRVTP